MWFHLLAFFIFLRLPFSSGVEMKQISVLTVTGIKGGSAALPCDVSHPKDDTIWLILWFRDTLTTPIYRFDDRSLAPGKKSHWFDEEILDSRAVLNVSSSPAMLRLSSLVLSDQGLYKCRVDFKSQPTKTTRVNLQVVVPPKGVSLSVGTPGSTTTRPVTRVVGPYLEGDIISLTCVAHGGTPRATILWYEDSYIVDRFMESHEPEVTTEGLDVFFNNTALSPWPTETTSTTEVPLSTHPPPPAEDTEAFNTLTLGPLTRADLKKVFTCHASNNNITRPVSTDVTIDMNLPPLSVVVSPPEEPLTAGTEYQIRCQVKGSRPPPSITWWNNDMRLPKAMHTQTSLDGNITTSILAMKPTALDDEALLKCVAESAQTNNTLEDAITLSVFYVPVASAGFGSSLNSGNIKEGDDVYFECVIRANPRVTHVSWRLNNELLEHDLAAGIIVSNQSLVLQRVVRSQAGKYTCHAHNIIGDGNSNSLQLDVKYAPVCSPGQVTTYAVGRYEDAEVTCEVEANPLEATFQWTFNNTADTIDVPQGRYTSTSNHSVITYTPMTALDYGTLLCWASNEIGSQQEPCLYHIVPAGKPDPPGNCSVIQRSRTSVRIHCMPGNSGGLKQSFILQARLHNGKDIINFTASNPVFQVDGLKPKQKYNLYISAHNDKGTSTQTLLTVSSIRTTNFLYQLHDGPSEAEVRDGGKTGAGGGVSFTFGRDYLDTLSLPSLIPAALGVGAGLILVIIILIFLIIFRTRRPTNPPASCSSLAGSEHSKNGSKSPSMTPKQTTSCSERDLQVESESDAEPDVIPLQEGFRGLDPEPNALPATLLPPDCYQYPAASTTSLIHSIVTPHHIQQETHATPSTPPPPPPPSSTSVSVPLLEDGLTEAYIPPASTPSSSYIPHQDHPHHHHHHHHRLHHHHHHLTHQAPPPPPPPVDHSQDHQLPMSSSRTCLQGGPVHPHPHPHHHHHYHLQQHQPHEPHEPQKHQQHHQPTSIPAQDGRCATGGGDLQHGHVCRDLEEGSFPPPLQYQTSAKRKRASFVRDTSSQSSMSMACEEEGEEDEEGDAPTTPLLSKRESSV